MGYSFFGNARGETLRTITHYIVAVRLIVVVDVGVGTVDVQVVGVAGVVLRSRPVVAGQASTRTSHRTVKVISGQRGKRQLLQTSVIDNICRLRM